MPRLQEMAEQVWPVQFQLHPTCVQDKTIPENPCIIEAKLDCLSLLVGCRVWMTWLAWICGALPIVLGLADIAHCFEKLRLCRMSRSHNALRVDCCWWFVPFVDRWLMVEGLIIRVAPMVPKTVQWSDRRRSC